MNSQLVRQWSSSAEDAIPLTLARAGGTGRAVVIVPSAFGVSDDLLEQMVELAEDARLVVTYDPFFRTDPRVSPYEDMPGVMQRLSRLDRLAAYRDALTVIAWTRAQADVSGVIGVGVCFGGPFVLSAASEGLLDGFVTWHGSRMENFLSGAAAITCPVHLHYGSVDPVTPAASISALCEALPHARVFVHEGATHGFSHRAAPQAYHASAERAGMDSVRTLIAR